MCPTTCCEHYFLALVSATNIYQVLSILWHKYGVVTLQKLIHDHEWAIHTATGTDFFVALFFVLEANHATLLNNELKCTSSDLKCRFKDEGIRP